jgi:hypothetical protein
MKRKFITNYYGDGDNEGKIREYDPNPIDIYGEWELWDQHRDFQQSNPSKDYKQYNEICNINKGVVRRNPCTILDINDKKSYANEYYGLWCLHIILHENVTNDLIHVIKDMYIYTPIHINVEIIGLSFVYDIFITRNNTIFNLENVLSSHAEELIPRFKNKFTCNNKELLYWQTLLNCNILNSSNIYMYF